MKEPSTSPAAIQKRSTNKKEQKADECEKTQENEPEKKSTKSSIQSSEEKPSSVSLVPYSQSICNSPTFTTESSYAMDVVGPSKSGAKSKPEQTSKNNKSDGRSFNR
ncbi:hypothetical protein M3Y98_00054300 [Aphelenchoides besseyi]|nr:hypothetical protein M3Y98_00054300 [Aphelenchoides besseyi]